MELNWPILGLFVSGWIMLLLRDWRVTVSALLLNYGCIAWFLAEQNYLQPDLQLGAFAVSTTVLVKLVTGLAVSAILAVTGATFAREYGLEELDEFSRAELRRASRRAERTREAARFGDYILPFWVGLLVMLTSITLPYLYPIAPSPSADFAWLWLALAGMFALVIAGDVLKIGLGLLLCTSGIDLLYTAALSASGGGISVWPLLLLSLVTILLALMIAYLSGLLFGRLKTLELAELYRIMTR